MTIYPGGLTTSTTPQSPLDNWGRPPTTRLPPPLAVHPELTSEDVAWLNDQLALAGRPVRYVTAEAGSGEGVCCA